MLQREVTVNNVGEFILAGVVYTAVSIIVTLLINMVLYRRDLRGAIKLFNLKTLLKKKND